MPPSVIAELAAFGVLTRQRLLDLGLPPSEIRRLLRTHALVRVRRGVYTSAAVWRAADRIGRCRLASRAAILTMRRGWVLSHDSAAYEHGMPILAPATAYVHVTRPGFTNAWTENGVKHHLARFEQRQLVDVGGMAALDLARTAVDVARERGRRHGLVACDAAMRMGVDRAELSRAVEPMVSWPGSVSARWAVEAADPDTDNMSETLGRELVLEAGIGAPETQFPVRTVEGVKWCDIRVGNLLIECDSLIKLLPPEQGGVADRPAAEIVFEERKRERLVKDEDFAVVRLYWEDYWGPRRAAAIDRLRREHADAVARFGPDLPSARAREAAQIRAHHDRRRPA